ncbi:MAG: M48 family metalloprotease [Chloroflexota bacterium]
MGNQATRPLILLLLLTLLMVSFVIPAAALEPAAQPAPTREPAFEQEILDRLSAINPGAVPIFQLATQSADNNDLQAARQGFEQVLILAPDFPDALRRLSYVEAELGEIESALQHAQQAYALDDNPYNETALARALIATGQRNKIREALTHAQAAVAAMPDDDQANLILLMAGAAYEDEDSIRQATTNLLNVAPQNPVTHYYAGLLAAMDSQWEKAESELLLAQELGMPAEEVQAVLSQDISSQARLYRWLRWGEYAVGGWLGGLGILLLFGLVLSQATLATVQRAIDQSGAVGQLSVSRGEQWVRSLYRLVIAGTSSYFYVSIPFLILTVVAATAGIFYLFLQVGRIPVRLAIFVGLSALYTLVAIARSLFTRVKEGEPGRLLAPAEAPALWALTDEVASRVDSRPIEAIYVTAGTEIGVFERGGVAAKWRGLGQRCLILGLGALPGLTEGQFKAILAHEYGHFSNRDTAGGNLAHQVQRSIHHLAYRLATTGQARWYNPAWLFINGYYRIFLRVTLGASRLQEILADRYATLAYGVKNMVEGLRHIVRQNLLFNMQLNQEIGEAVQQKRPLQNLYMLPTIEPGPQQQDLDEAFDKAISRPTSAYDSHPAIKDRIALVQHLKQGDDQPGDAKPAASLLPTLEQLQKEMTTLVQNNLRRST